MLGSLLRPPATAALPPVPRRAPYLSNPEAPLLALSPYDAWRLRDAFEGTQIMGATGSGKTSGSGRAIAHAFLKAGMGGLVLCAAPGERAMWERYAKECGRTPSLVIFDGSGARRLNFLHYELGRHAQGHALTLNAVRLMQHILDVAEGRQGADTTENPFWRSSSQELIANAVMPLWAAWGRVTLAEMMKFIFTAPRSERAWRAMIKQGMKLRERKEAAPPGVFSVQRQIEEQERAIFWMATMDEIGVNPAYPMPEPDFDAVEDYWVKTFARGDDRTISNIVSTLSARMAPFLTGRMREIFCTDTNIVPELTHEGCIIIMDFPIPEWDEAGILAQQIMKYLWQRSVERRDAAQNDRPVFLWADECQYFLSPYDAKYQAICRKQRACTVYITQNLPTYYDRIGSRRPEHTANALLGNFQTKIWHNNSDPQTNQWAADVIGKSVQWRRNLSIGENDGWNEGWNDGWSEGESTGQSGGVNYGINEGRSTNRGRSWGDSGGWSSTSSPQGGSSSRNYGWNYGGSDGSGTSEGTSAGTNEGWNVGTNTGRSGGRSGGKSGGTSRNMGASETIDYQIQPGDFTRLRNGGTANRLMIDGIVYQGGRTFRHSRSTFLPCVFRQA